MPVRRDITSTDHQTAARPVTALALDYKASTFEPPHAHPRAQLLHATSGVMQITTAAASWIIPPGRALWLPAFTIHEVRCRGDVSFRTLYIDAEMAGVALPKQAQVIAVSDLLTELILEAIALPLEYDRKGRDGRLMSLILDEIQRMPVLPLSLVMPDDPRLRRVCAALLENPGDQSDLDQWARKAGMARRTLTRRFRAETGMGFGEWRQQLRLLEGLSRIVTGQSVTGAALDAGYHSPSAFTAAFASNLGVPPSKYRSR